MRIAAIIVMMMLAACPRSQLVYDQGDPRSGFVVSRTWDKEVAGGWPGQLHPTVIEYLFGSPDAPWADYYAALPAGHASLGELQKSATAIAGSRPRGEHYARAQARQLAPHINEALRVRPGAAKNGTGVEVMCCHTVNRDTGKLELGRVFADIAISPRSQMVRMQWQDAQMLRILTWDLSRVPHAFEPAAELDYATVATSIRSMHPPQPRYP